MKNETMSRVFLVTTLVLFAGVVILSILFSEQSSQIERTTTAFGDSLRVMRLDVDSLKGQVPGLGEYMTTNQLHMAKLWFAARSSNWELAKYELDELTETMEAAEGLHVFRNGVNISPVLQSTRETQVQLLQTAVARHDLRALRTAYNQTLAACNSCHVSAGYGFIHIIVPTHEPVANQRWDVVRR